ncbi:MAG: VOC family protein [Alphaproteobacteria bacterium]|nr:VOC family protein [Alphaproteobacteria bacterium]
MVTGYAHIGIRVHDLARSRAFYERLGFVFVAGPLGPEPVALLRHPSGVEINLILNAASASSPNMLMDLPEKYPGYTDMALAVGDVGAVEAALRDAGIRITGSRGDPAAKAAVFVRDPDGSVIELARRG